MLVQDHGELVVLLAHPCHGVRQREGVRQQQRAAGEGARGGGGEGSGGQPHQLAHAEDAGDVVRVVAEHRVVRVTVPRDELDRLGGGGVVADEDGGHPRHHHLVEGPLGELQGVVEQFGGVLGQFTLLVGLADEVAQLLQGRAVVQFLDGLDAHPAQQPVGGAVEDVHDRADDLQVGERGGGQGLRQAFGDGQREVLGCQFTEDHLDDGGRREREDDGDPADRALRDPEAGQGRFEQGGDGRFGDEADDQAGDGDAQLGAGQHERQPFQHGQGAGGPPVARRRVTREGEPVGGDVGELLGDEIAGAGGEDEDGQQARHGVHGTHRAPPRRVPRSDRSAEIRRGGRGLCPGESVCLADTGLLLQ